MKSDLIFRIVLAILFILVIATRKSFENRSARVAVRKLKQDLDSRTSVLIQSLLLTLSNLGIIAYLIHPSWMTWSAIPLPKWAQWIGTVFGIAGAGLLIWTHRVLGENFFGGTKIRQGHQLITAGPYRRVRHPMYTAFILLGLAWFLLSGNWFIGGFWLAATLLVVISRVNEEEKMMLAEFGAEYQSYMRQTGRFLPKL